MVASVATRVAPGVLSCLLALSPTSASAQQLTVADVRTATAHTIEAGRATALLLSEQLAEAPADLRLASTSAAYRALLVAVHGHARALWNAGEQTQAAEVALGFLATPPVNARAGEALPTGHYFLCDPVCPEYNSEAMVALLPANRRTTGMLNDLAFYIIEAPFSAWERLDVQVAQSTLQQIVRLRPQRTAAMLNLADLLWAEERHEEAQAIYRSFLDARGARAPARVRTRIAGVPTVQERPAAPRFGPEPTITEPDEYSYQATATLGTLERGEISYISTSSTMMDDPADMQLIWTRGERRIVTDLDGATGGTPTPYQVRLRGGVIEVRYYSGAFAAAGTTYNERWRLNVQRGRFVRVSRTSRSDSEPIDYARAQLARVLRAGEDFERARGMMLALGPYGVTTHTDNGPEMRAALFAARLRAAAAWPRPRRAALAHAMVIELIALVGDRMNDVGSEEVELVVRRATRWAGPSAEADILRLLQRFEYTDEAPSLAALRDRLSE